MTGTRRVRKCKECNKRLGGTLVRCHECGGEKPEPDPSERILDAVRWKLMLGVDEELIEEAHEADVKYAKV